MRIGNLFVDIRWRERLDVEERIRHSITENVRGMLRDRHSELYQAVVRVSRGVIKDVIQEQQERLIEASKSQCETEEYGTWGEHSFGEAGFCTRCREPDWRVTEAQEREKRRRAGLTAELEGLTSLRQVPRVRDEFDAPSRWNREGKA